VSAAERDKWDARYRDVVDGRLDVHIGLDDAGLLKGEPGSEDRVPLIRLDRWRGKVGPLQLAGGHLGRQAGRLSEDLSEPLRVVQRPLPASLVCRDDCLHNVGMLGGEVLVDVEDAPRVEPGLAVEELGALFQLGFGHHRVETCPGIDRPPNKGVPAVGMLEEHRLDVRLR
jgi:hypothetical protein